MIRLLVETVVMTLVGLGLGCLSIAILPWRNCELEEVDRAWRELILRVVIVARRLRSRLRRASHS